MGREVVAIYWPDQTWKDWWRFDPEEYPYGLMLEVYEAFREFLGDPNPSRRGVWPIEHKLKLYPLAIVNMECLGPGAAELAPSFWAHPRDFADAAERFALALQRRDPDALPILKEDMVPLFRSTQKEERPEPEQRDWDDLRLRVLQAADVARRVAAMGITLITLDVGMAFEGVWACDPNREFDPNYRGESDGDVR